MTAADFLAKFRAKLESANDELAEAKALAERVEAEGLDPEPQPEPEPQPQGAALAVLPNPFDRFVADLVDSDGTDDAPLAHVDDVELANVVREWARYVTADATGRTSPSGDKFFYTTPWVTVQIYDRRKATYADKRTRMARKLIDSQR